MPLNFSPVIPTKVPLCGIARRDLRFAPLIKCSGWEFYWKQAPRPAQRRCVLRTFSMTKSGGWRRYVARVSRTEPRSGGCASSPGRKPRVSRLLRPHCRVAARNFDKTCCAATRRNCFLGKRTPGWCPGLKTQSLLTQLGFKFIRPVKLIWLLNPKATRR